ncbi:hypothetical protein E5083_11650 [Streptomyces bauhiniae]|uniref:DUF5304 domain-containing protein n=1 Tax=Streptomyces bauhiniae TaxID=2340725 RepID=A0A4Z1D6M3_9ACTN|nr:DUF5304 domain-containing protein [Streptomyces bauhiniae]TGN77858.1 hypothetical protein E5083_11650 [Streptomyces bauhiniae]
MSEERPAPQPPEEPEAPEAPRMGDADAWATATAEDLAAEKARRRGTSPPPPGTAAEELRRLMDSVADKLSGLQSPLLGAVAGPAAQQAVRQMVQQAKAAVEPVVERNPQVFDHLAAAGSELLAAYRSAVQAQEQRWTTGPTPPPADPPPTGRRDPGEGTGPGERIDLD